MVLYSNLRKKKLEEHINKLENDNKQKRKEHQEQELNRKRKVEEHKDVTMQKIKVLHKFNIRLKRKAEKIRRRIFLVISSPDCKIVMEKYKSQLMVDLNITLECIRRI